MTMPTQVHQVKAWVPLLLAERSASLRRLVLTDLLGRPHDDPEVRELTDLIPQDPIVMNLLALQEADGSWRHAPSGTWGTGAREADPWDGIRATSQALVTLGYLALGRERESVRSAAEFLFSRQLADGSWPLPRSKAERELREPYAMIPLQTGIPLRALAAAGYATDPRAERAYEWLLGHRLSEGSWPSGKKGGKHVFPAGYRRLAHSQFGCRTNTTFAVSALALHPLRRSSQEARKGLGQLLAQEIMQAHSVGYEVARTIGVERSGGYFTYFARHDVALLLDLCWRTGASLDDPRVAALVGFVKENQGPYGLWDYGTRPEASRWVSFDLLRSLSRIDSEGDWISTEPRVPFQPYPKRPRRY